MKKVDQNIKLKIIIISGIISFLYYFLPLIVMYFLEKLEHAPVIIEKLVVLFAKIALKYPLIFSLSIGIYEGMHFVLTGTIWPYVIQIVLFLISWFLLYWIIKLGYLFYRNIKKYGLVKKNKDIK